MKKYKTVKLLFVLCLVFQTFSLICYANSNRFSGGSFDGYDDSIFGQSGDGDDEVNSKQRYGGGSFDGYDDSIFEQSGDGGDVNSNQRYGGGSFDGYSDATFIQSGAGADDLNSKQRFSGGFFDGYDNAVFGQSGSGADDLNSKQRFSGGFFDGYDNAVFGQSGSGADDLNSKQRFSGGFFDGYDNAVFGQSGSGADDLNSKQRFSGGFFDGYNNSIYAQSGGDLTTFNQRFGGGSFDGYDNNYFEYPTPFIEITNATKFRVFSQTTAEISGTNLNIAGQLAWVNNRFPNATNWFNQGFEVEVTGLAEGSNTLTIIGANYLSNYVSDSVTIYRETFEDVHPFIKITNAPSEVAYNISSAEISGTNLNIAGEMWWTNSLTGDSGSIPVSGVGFQVSGINLEHGDNLITIFGTNIYGMFTNDFVNINRETWDEVHPFIDITNENETVNYSVATYTIAGTNNENVVGGTWTNSLTGETGTAPISNFEFQISNFSLAVGENIITVSGTNIYGQSTNDVVSIQRKTLIESEPQISTNALIFPFKNSPPVLGGVLEEWGGENSGAIILAPFPTNIIWDIEKISDDIDGTNLIITKISVYLSETTNEVASVTNNISNLLGEIPWLVPENLIGNETNYVLKFEVVDSSSLTNSRIFWDNKFTVVPEPGVFGAVISYLLLVLGTWRKLIPIASSASG